MKREQLEQLDDSSLLDEARRAGVSRPEVLTREEQLDAIEVLEERATGRREGSKGFLSRARTLLADFLERGLNLPQTADRVRDPESPAAPAAGDSSGATGASDDDDGETGAPDVATFTLAQIYVAQGHPERALTVLAQVLRAEPGNAAARRLQAKLQGLPVPADLADDEDEDEDEDDSVSPTLPTGQVINAPSSAALTSKPAADTQASDEAASDETTEADAEAAARAAAAEQTAVEAAKTEAAPAGAPRPAPMLDEVPLPERYGVDEVVLMPVDPTTLYLYWEVRPETAAAARRFEPHGHLRLRVEQVAVGGLRRPLRSFEVGEVGDRQLVELPAGARCVAELGWDFAGGWRPLVASQAGQLPPAHAVAEPARRVVHWRQEQAVVLNPVPVDAALADAIRDAVNNVPAPRAAALPFEAWTGHADRVVREADGGALLTSPDWATEMATSDDPFALPAAPWTPAEVDGPHETSVVALGSSESLTLRRPLGAPGKLGSSGRLGSSEKRAVGSSEHAGR